MHSRCIFGESAEWVDFNDQLLLGLKATMSQAELHVIRARLQGGKCNKARSMIQWIRYRYQIPAPVLKRPEELTVQEVARHFEVGTGVVYYWLKTGQLAARRGAGNRLCIPWTSQIEADCRARI